MAHNQNPQGFASQYAQYHNSPNAQHHSGAYYTTQQNPTPQIGRRGSFEAGDDRPFYDEGKPSSHGSSPYVGGQVSMPNQNQYMPGFGGSPGMHQAPNAGNTYSYQGAPQPPAAAPYPPYNPQQQQQQQQQQHQAYNPQQYAQYPSAASSSPQSASGRSGYQPYNPAAYQPSPQPSTYGFAPTPTTYQPPVQFPTYSSDPPPVPHRPFEYPPRFPQAQQQAPPQPSYQQHPQYSPDPQRPPHLPPRQQPAPPTTHSVSYNSTYPNAYTPPAPPPPPISPRPDLHDRPNPPPRARTHSNTSSATPAPQRANSRQHELNQQLPSLMTYSGSGDYATQHSNAPSAAPDTPLGISLPIQHAPPPPQHHHQPPPPPQRAETLNRHPHARPLPGPPTGSEASVPTLSPPNGGSGGFDDIMAEVEAAAMGHSQEPSPRYSRHGTGASYDLGPTNGGEEPAPLFSASNRPSVSPDVSHTHTNGLRTSGSGIDVAYEAYSDESDAEAAAGLAAMQMAEEQEAADRARGVQPSGTFHSREPSEQSNHLRPQDGGNSGSGSGSDVGIDMDTYGGLPSSFSMRYGNQPSPSRLTPLDDRDHRHTPSAISLQRSDASSEILSMPAGDYSMASDAIHPFPAFGARTDTGGTGGLAEPSAYPRRLSFEDGDEAPLVDGADYVDPASQAPSRSSMRSSVTMPVRTGSRPLPPTPGGGADPSRLRRQTDEYGRPVYPQAPDEYESTFTPGGTAVQKANSIGSYSNTPYVVPPGRSITDAEQRRRAGLSSIRTSVLYEGGLAPESAMTASGAKGVGLGNLDLPAIPTGKRRKFVPNKLSTNEFARCKEPWAQSSVLGWLVDMTEGESDLKESALAEAVVALFTHKVPTMNTADAEALSARLVAQMSAEGALVKDEEWVKFGSTPMSGVIFQLTGTGCYAPLLHASNVTGRCYSHHCMRTLKKINLLTHGLAPARKLEDWATFYKIKKEDLEGVPRKDIERQNVLHEIVTSEDFFMDQLNVLRVLYRDGLKTSREPILSAKRLDVFARDVFGKVDAVKQANEDYLLAQLKYRQEEQGPWIKGFSDIFREWIRKAKAAYIDYAANLPNATFLMRRESERNVLFRQFLDQMRDNERSRRLGWDTYLKAPITRLQRYSLLMATVQKNMPGDSEEKTNLGRALDEVKAVTMECDARVAEESKRTSLTDLQHKLKLRPGMDKVQLNLSHLGREVVYQGALQRRGGNRVNWLDTHAILFDHYMVLAKPMQQRDAAGGLKYEMYDVSKLPIPMDLLVLESTNDDPVIKSTVKGITSVSAIKSTNAAAASPNALTQVPSNSAASVGSGNKTLLASATTIDSANDKVMYPFRVKHLGKTDIYVLYAPTAVNRTEWCDRIIEAKTRHAASLRAQNAEPFRLRVLADTAFGYDSASAASVGPRSVVIKGTPLDRAVEQCDRSFYGTGPRPGYVCRATVNCATTFMHPSGKRYNAVGTDYGVYVSDAENARGWTRAIAANAVIQIAVLEDFSLFVIISERSLVAHHLEQVCASGGASAADNSRRPPQRLSGRGDVGFFATGRMKDRALMFYKKRDGITSTFKVLEPVYQKSSSHGANSVRGRFGLKKGATDFFRDFDDFYIPSETYALNLFTASLAVATQRGIEVMTLDKKVPFSVPDTSQPHVGSIAGRIAGQRPLGMFRLSDNEFLLVFEEVGIYADKHGDVSRAVVMEFVGKAKQACLAAGTYLILVDTGGGFVEVRNAVNGRLRQVISGRDVRLLDDGQRSSATDGTVKIAMQHPEIERSQIVLEMLVNEGLKEE